jgi:hypothetical protein
VDSTSGRRTNVDVQEEEEQQQFALDAFQIHLMTLQLPRRNFSAHTPAHTSTSIDDYDNDNDDDSYNRRSFNLT